MLTRITARCLPRCYFTILETHKLFTERIDRLVEVIRAELKPTFLRVKDITTKTIDDDQMIQVEVES